MTNFGPFRFSPAALGTILGPNPRILQLIQGKMQYPLISVKMMLEPQKLLRMLVLIHGLRKYHKNSSLEFPLSIFGYHIVLLFPNNGKQQKTHKNNIISQKKLLQSLATIIISLLTNFGVIIITISNSVKDFRFSKYIENIYD